VVYELNLCLLSTKSRQKFSEKRAQRSVGQFFLAQFAEPDLGSRFQQAELSRRRDHFGTNLILAYRYLQHARRLKKPVAVGEPKLAFTVKLPRSLIQRVRLYASVKKLSISEVVNRALLALLPRGRGRG
jgi:hypothetical protein